MWERKTWEITRLSYVTDEFTARENKYDTICVDCDYYIFFLLLDFRCDNDDMPDFYHNFSSLFSFAFEVIEKHGEA